MVELDLGSILRLGVRLRDEVEVEIETYLDLSTTPTDTNELQLLFKSYMSTKKLLELTKNLHRQNSVLFQFQFLVQLQHIQNI